MQQTVLLISTMLQVIKVLHLMTQVYSTAHTFLYRWFVAVGADSFQPKIGFKTRYGIVANPFAKGATLTTLGDLSVNSTVYYRRVKVNNITYKGDSLSPSFFLTTILINLLTYHIKKEVF